MVCDRKNWLESRFQCYLWKAFPHGDAGELAAEKEATKDAAAEERLEPSDDEVRRRPRRLLRDADGVYYVGDAAKVHELSMPLLHSIQGILLTDGFCTRGEC